jgi:hypothetical protein
MKHWVCVVMIGLSMGLLGLQGLALACTCAQPASVQEGLKQADAVFLGLVERFELKGSGRLATFRVHTVWKGPEASRVRVSTGGGDGDCGYHFIVGVKYLVFARHGHWNTLQTNICTRTKQASGEAVDDLKALGPGTPVTRHHDD